MSSSPKVRSVRLPTTQTPIGRPSTTIGTPTSARTPSSAQLAPKVSRLDVSGRTAGATAAAMAPAKPLPTGTRTPATFSGVDAVGGEDPELVVLEEQELGHVGAHHAAKAGKQLVEQAV